ncbi:MAG TPA: nucleotidyltransferase family protein [Tetrasphaera sp.]|jgi:CTP:molybdopterin cytidylyltransferase MocA|nr:nucleotidyltransferase family protein [Tetrasphaera sp.]
MPSAPHPTRLGVVLAAGAGKRFGGPKVHAADGAWLAGAIDALAAGGCDAVAVSLGAAIVDLPEGVLPIMVPDWAQGMSASVRAAIEQAHLLGTGQLVLHLVDLPDVDHRVVARVLAAAGDGRGALARAAYGGRPGHPVVVGAEHWPALRARLAGDAGGRAFLTSRRDLRVVECGDLATGRDIDTRPGP